MIVDRPISNEGLTRRRERELIRIHETFRGDPTMTAPRFLGKKGVSLEFQESTTRKDPIRFSTAFCMWLLIGGPLL